MACRVHLPIEIRACMVEDLSIKSNQEPMNRSLQLPYKAYVTAFFSDWSIFSTPFDRNMVELHAPTHRLLVKADFTVQRRIQDFLMMGCTSKKGPQSNLMFFFVCLLFVLFFCFFFQNTVYFKKPQVISGWACAYPFTPSLQPPLRLLWLSLSYARDCYKKVSRQYSWPIRSWSKLVMTCSHAFSRA